MRRILSILLILSLVITCNILSVSAAGSCSTVATDLPETNISGPNVNVRTAIVKSFLHPLKDGRLMTVNYVEKESRLEISYYSSAFKLQDSLTVYPDLPLWGGFYATDDAYYVITGQSNEEEAPDVEVIRVTKYNTNWEIIGSAGVFDADVRKPFVAGQVRCAMAGNVLAVHTSRHMYEISGVVHQSNFSFSVDVDEMELIDFRTGHSTGSGYVSHSFDQYIYYDGEKFVTVDHGDGFPRAVVLNEHYPSSFKLPNKIGSAKSVNFFTMPGESGDNDTGISTGGFGQSSTTYIVVGSSRWDDNSNPKYRSRPYNVFVSAMDRTTYKTTVYTLTDYSSGKNAYTPHLVKISDSAFMVLWSCEGTVYYQKLNGNGAPVGKVYSFTGTLSYNTPQVVNGKVLWYSYDNNEIKFHTISTSDWSDAKVKTINNGHRFADTGNSEEHWRLCSDCGYTTPPEPHSEETFIYFSKNGTRDIRCNSCWQSIKSESISVTVTEGTSESGGQALKISLKTASGQVLKSTVDYTWSRTATTYCQVGGKIYAKKVTYTFTNTGTKQGSFSRTFYRLPDVATFSPVEAQAYTGKAVTPNINITVDGKKLKKGTDYTLSYKNNKEVGTATVTITGKGEYFGTATKTFNIADNIANAKVSGISAKTYTGKPLTQNPKVVLKGKTLKFGTDYTVSYSNNTKVGTATLTIKGAGSYAGTIKKTFKINPQSISKCKVKLADTAYSYNGKTKTPTVIVKNASGTKLTRNTHYTVTYASDRKYVGKYKVTVKMKGNYSGTKTLYFTINPAKTTVSKLTAGKKSIKVNITKKSSQVTGYEVQYSTAKTFKSAKTKTISSYKTTSTTLSKLSAKKTYYVRVRTYKTVNGTKYYSGWSSAKNIKTK